MSKIPKITLQRLMMRKTVSHFLQIFNQNGYWVTFLQTDVPIPAVNEIVGHTDTYFTDSVTKYPSGVDIFVILLVAN